MSDDRKPGMRYVDRGEIFEWVHGTEAIPMREMHDMEMSALHTALYISRNPLLQNNDQREDEMAHVANHFEKMSHQFEARGMDLAATDANNAAMALDRMARAIRYLV